jgi:hypothetical protein
MPGAYDLVRARSRGITKIVVWCPVSLPFVASALRSCGDTPVAEVIRHLKEAARAQGKSYREVADDVRVCFISDRVYVFNLRQFFVKSLKGEVYSLPDLPPMVDYELYPQRLEVCGTMQSRYIHQCLCYCSTVILGRTHYGVRRTRA